MTQPGPEVSAPWTYREKLFNLLAGRDPIEVLGQTAFALADIVARHPAEILRGRAIQGKWTPNEIIGHLTDSEWVYGYRLRLILCEDEPAILGFRQDAWVASLRHNEREPSELVEIFRTLRVLNLSVWKRMSPEDLQRSGQHNERGAESLAAYAETGQSGVAEIAPSWSASRRLEFNNLFSRSAYIGTKNGRLSSPASKARSSRKSRR